MLGLSKGSLLWGKLAAERDFTVRGLTNFRVSAEEEHSFLTSVPCLSDTSFIVSPRN